MDASVFALSRLGTQSNGVALAGIHGNMAPLERRPGQPEGHPESELWLGPQRRQVHVQVVFFSARELELLFPSANSRVCGCSLEGLRGVRPLIAGVAVKKYAVRATSDTDFNPFAFGGGIRMIKSIEAPLP